MLLLENGGAACFVIPRAVRRIFFAILFVPALARAAEAPAPPTTDLADRFSSAVLAAARKSNAHAVRVDLQGEPGLEGAPALFAISREIERALYGEGKLSPAGGATAADLEIVATLSRVRGRVALGGALTARGAAVDWVIASVEETPEWWPWLAPAIAAPPAASGFVWRRAGTLPTAVEDADAGDLDSDGAIEFVVATATELIVLRAGEPVPEPIARVSLDDAEEPAAIATRAPRTFVRIATSATGAPEIFVRRTDEKRTRVYGWDAGRLVRHADRDGLTLAARMTARGADIVAAEPTPGMNGFDGPPRIRRAAPATAVALEDVAWIDFRPASLSPVARISETIAHYGRLDAKGTLHLLRADGGEAARLPACGAAFALTDLDGDGAPDAICSAFARGDTDRLSVTLSGAGLRTTAWTTPVEGSVAAIAADGPVALVFVTTRDGATEVWLLRGAR